MRSRNTPIILVTADVRPADGYVWHAVAETYLRAITSIGAVPLILPSMADRIDLDAAVEMADGVLVTGSRSNVHPDRYGVTPEEKHGPFDPSRDATTLPLIRLVLQRGLPLLAVCRGFQELNVALGGALLSEVQEIEGRFDHRSQADEPDQRFALAHDVTFAPDSRLATIVGNQRIRVNSVHRQGVDRLGRGLVVEATADDGTIEAVRVSDAASFAFGVQWHPEYWAESDPPSRAIFAAFSEAIRQHQDAKAKIAAEQDT
ncbi:gamma-glutamyl-gamma-aminobutyrate hydrolase family protein [Afifella sp. H1R]|uniref:gamma-glutamyl-gamma-aminobutyrate hydrolase family protein n=1 Tax=Afifella sp. H1R TaxID=2908841 RepID=UPI001F473258|nr:gamma-glutamyl-gamma-aminobutyrate hydrolase family protein [Afifella sp. H1R]MCF1505300.1 gamma-glutamyl-gamma-aminobutyrate hydrolase family protein [Afifella sp. H1R]